MTNNTNARDDAKVIEVVLTFESDPAFSASEVEAIARRCADFAEDTAEDMSFDGAEIVYGIDVKQVVRVTGDAP
jgi:hypothetical protein